MRARLRAFLLRLRYSLFLEPLLAVVGGVVLAIVSLLVDRGVDDTAGLPFGLASTVESARSLLSTVAAATITFAGVAFSISLLVIQQAAAQYSPRIVHTLFRDPFNKRVMALVLGTFTYCLVVLRSVRSPLDDGGDPVVPHLSVSLAVVLGILTILAVVAFIDHSAQRMDISTILERARSDAAGQIEDDWELSEPGTPSPARPVVEPLSAWEVRFDRSGWVQQLDHRAFLDCLPAGSTAVVHIVPGRYAVVGTLLCTASASPADPARAERAVNNAVTIGDTRTLQQDPSFGIRELVDVALRALSPGVNDPTTAQDAIFHAVALLVEILRRDPPPPIRQGRDGRTLVLPEQATHDDLVRLAFDEVRRVSVDHPTVCVYLLEALALVDDAVAAAGLHDRRASLRAQADLIVAGCARADLLPSDLDLVRQAHVKRFGPGWTGSR